MPAGPWGSPEAGKVGPLLGHAVRIPPGPLRGKGDSPGPESGVWTREEEPHSREAISGCCAERGPGVTAPVQGFAGEAGVAMVGTQREPVLHAHTCRRQGEQETQPGARSCCVLARWTWAA